jgi:hypothetical protein
MNMKILFTLVLSVLVALFLVAGVHAAEVKLIADDGDDGDLFGSSVAIDGNYAIVGAWEDDVGLNRDQGSAYIFFWDGTGWVQQQKLTNDDGAFNDYYGHSVAIDGNYAIVGASGKEVNGNSDQGSAYLFKRKTVNPSSWTEQAKLIASDGTANDKFGHSVAIAGDYAIVGANGDDSFTGSAYIFKRDDKVWTQQAKLTSSDGTDSDQYGYSVAISGDYAIVGAEYADPYIFKRGGSFWTQTAKLTASDGTDSDQYDYSVAISGDYAIVGAYADAVGGNSLQGSAYLFKRDGTGTWPQQATLTASDGAAGDLFGHSVAIDGNHAIVGAVWDDGSGSAYVYDISGEDPGSESIPEFSTIAIPIAALLGLVFLFSRRRGREE